MVLRARSDSHGSARWATAADLAEVNCLDGDGLLAGKIAGMSMRQAFKYLWRAPARSSRAAARLLLDRRTGHWVTLHDWVHGVVYAPPGAGKTTCVSAPFLYTCSDSMVVVDPKGEMARLLSDWRREKFGHEIAVVDPFLVCTNKPSRFNPLSLIDANSPLLLNEALAQAEEIVTRTGKEQDQHWNDMAARVIAAGIAVAMTECDPAYRDLQAVTVALASREGFGELLAAVKGTEACAGMLRRLGGSLSFLVDREFGSVMTATNRHLGVFSTPAVYQSTTGMDFDPLKLVDGRGLDIFLVLPPDKLESHKGLMRLWLGSLIRFVFRNGVQRNRKVRILIEEAGMFGPTPAINMAIEQGRGYGISLLSIFQNDSQLLRCFPDGGDQTFRACMDVSIYMGVRDYATAKAVSDRLGEMTVEGRGRSGGWNAGGSIDTHGGGSASWGDQGGWSTNEMARPLLKPDEVIRLDDREAIVLARNLPPMLTRLVPYYGREFNSRPPLPTWWLNVKAFLVMVASLALAATVLLFLMRKGVGDESLRGLREEQPVWIKPGEL